MKHRFLKLAGVTAIAAGLALGQSAPAQSPHFRGRPRAGMMLRRMAAGLNLTDAQKEQARGIFSAARQSAEPVQSQLRQSRQALAAAVKSGASGAEIDRLSNSMGQLLAQATAIHAKSFAHFYSILTPEQKGKLDSRLQRIRNGRGPDRPAGL